MSEIDVLVSGNGELGCCVGGDETVGKGRSNKSGVTGICKKADERSE